MYFSPRIGKVFLYLPMSILERETTIVAQRHVIPANPLSEISGLSPLFELNPKELTEDRIIRILMHEETGERNKEWESIHTFLPSSDYFFKERLPESEMISENAHILVVEAHIGGDFSDFTALQGIPRVNIDVCTLTVGEAGAAPLSGKEAVAKRSYESILAGSPAEIYEELLAIPEEGLQDNQPLEEQLIQHDGELVHEVAIVTNTIKKRLIQYEKADFPEVIISHSPKLSVDLKTDHPDHFVVYVALMKALEELKNENYFESNNIPLPAVYAHDPEFIYPSGGDWAREAIQKGVENGEFRDVYFPQYKLNEETGTIEPDTAKKIDLSQNLDSQIEKFDQLNQKLFLYPLNIPHFTIDITPYLSSMLASLYANGSQMYIFDTEGKIIGVHPYLMKIPLVWLARARLSKDTTRKGAQGYQQIITDVTNDKNLLANSVRTNVQELTYKRTP